MHSIACRATLRIVWIVIAAVATCLGGCGRSSNLVSVSGRITNGGKAVVGASINYQPIATSKDDIYPGPASFGITDADGRYTLRTFNSQLLGAIPGQHRICIALAHVGPQLDFAASPVDKMVPARFLDGSTVVEVSAEGETKLDFDIAKK
ncbi:MAG: hypothetical protein IT427_19155 [Pirellulales bacterium]|nr:hypothetical protein [Pirellulales bacterium]